MWLFVFTVSLLFFHLPLITVWDVVWSPRLRMDLFLWCCLFREIKTQEVQDRPWYAWTWIFCRRCFSFVCAISLGGFFSLLFLYSCVCQRSWHPWLLAVGGSFPGTPSPSRCPIILSVYVFFSSIYLHKQAIVEAEREASEAPLEMDVTFRGHAHLPCCFLNLWFCFRNRLFVFFFCSAGALSRRPLWRIWETDHQGAV